MEIKLRPLFRLDVEVAPGTPQLLGKVSPGYTRRIMPISGGHFAGERFSGKVLPGGADWVIVRPDGGLNLDVRLTLQTDQGDFIYLTYIGRRNGPPELMDKISRSEDIPRGSDYFRVALQFETAAPELLWLNDIIAIGTGYREPNGPVYEIFEVL